MTNTTDLEDTAGRRPHVPTKGSKSNTVAEAVNSVDRPVVSLKRQIHVFVCVLLGLNDEDHEDDEEAAPLEKIIIQLIQDHDKNLRDELLEALPEEYDIRPEITKYFRDKKECEAFNEALSEVTQAINKVYGDGG